MDVTLRFLVLNRVATGMWGGQIPLCPTGHMASHLASLNSAHSITVVISRPFDNHNAPIYSCTYVKNRLSVGIKVESISIFQIIVYIILSQSGSSEFRIYILCREDLPGN